MATRGQTPLLERDIELARVAELLADAEAGHGRVLVIEGPAGIGKTTLMAEICDHADEAGCRTLRARGGELEREYPHGVVRQLFEGELAETSDDQRTTLLSGAAELAASIVSPGSSGAPVGDPYAVNHGLYWLTANLAARGPLLIAVDDAQWGDVPSLRFLAHLARRMEGLELLLAVCIRTGEPEPDPSLAQLAAEPGAEVLRPPPLSVEAVGQIVARALGASPADEFSAACHRATGGTPFLVKELVAVLEAEGMRPDAEGAAHVGALGPRAVARAVLLRLERASDSAVALARAAAVLGGDARLAWAAQLAGIDREAAAEAADALATMDILLTGRPLEFVHPIVRGAIYEDIGAAARQAAHARAADVLAGAGAEPDAIATHLLLTEPSGRAEILATLRSAAQQAIARGAAENAVAYLRRALEEGGTCAEERAALLLELGKAERLVLPDSALERFREAHSLAPDPVLRARIAYDLVDTLVLMRPSWAEVARLIEASVADVEDCEPDLAVRLEALRVANEFYDARLLARRGGLLERLPQLKEMAGGETPARREVALQVANIVAWLGEPRDEVRRFLDLGVSGGHSPADENPESWLVFAAIQAFALIEDAQGALGVAERAIEISRSRGSVIGVGSALSSRAWVNARLGDLVSAEADTREVFALLEEIPVFEGGRAGTLFHAIDPLLERLELEQEARRIAVEEFGLDPHGLFWPLAHEARGRIRLMLGDREGAIADLNGVEQTLYAHNNPNGWVWRPALALAVAGSDPDRATELLGVYRERAEQIGLPRAIGIGLRTLGVIEGGEEGLIHLEEAVEVLRDSPARLEFARALVELGAARRRAGQRADAREPLREGLDLAHRCGATRLEARALEELRATGARPRRAMLTGRDALTATEQRIAGMAADGMSNPEIAQALFVTRKTVENHLSRIYPKLGINSREQLPEALAAEAP